MQQLPIANPLGWKQLGHEKRLQALIVNYADDFVICSRGQAAEALVTMQRMMTQLRFTIQVKDRVHLAQLIRNLRRVAGVNRVERERT